MLCLFSFGVKKFERVLYFYFISVAERSIADLALRQRLKAIYFFYLINPPKDIFKA